MKMPADYNPHTTTYRLSHNQGIDVVGDVHGCFDELMELLAKSGYDIHREGNEFTIDHPQNRMLFLSGDLTDRGPNSLDTLRFARSLAASGRGAVTMGNHDYKLLRKLSGRNVAVAYGLATTLDQLESVDLRELNLLCGSLRSLPTQVLVHKPKRDKLGEAQDTIIVHACAPSHHQGLLAKNSFERSVYGYPEGLDQAGHLIRRDWADDYTGEATVVHGHVPSKEPTLKNNVYNIDTGCVFGGRLTMLRVFEGEFLQVQAKSTYYERSGFADASKASA
jgi:protein phosphatase